jgi:hypothetical protein
MNFVSAGYSSLQGALLLARGKASGASLVESDAQGAVRSFWALPVCLPTIVCLRLMDWAGPGLPPDAAHALARDLMVFIVSWLLYAVVTHQLAPRFGRAHRWPHFIAAWNWCNVIENLLLVFGGIPGLLGAPHVVDQVSQLVTMGWALWLEWYAIKLTFSSGPLLAAFLVLLDQAIGLVLAGMAFSLSGGW